VAYVSGISYKKRDEQRNLAKLFRRVGGRVFNVGVLHANVGSNTGHEVYAPCEVTDLATGDMDYWALGHVHTRAVLHRTPYVVYPGNPQGRHIREAGPRGCMYVAVDEAGRVEPEPEFLPLDVVRWALVTADVTGVATLDALADRLAGAVEEALAEADGRPLLCRIAVTGRTTLHAELARATTVDDLVERLREGFANHTPFAWVEELELGVRPEIDLADRACADDLLGHVLQIAAAIREEDEKLAQLRATALAPLYENPRALKAKALEALTPADTREIVAEAELLCLDRLEAGQ
jgi:exonuclease SbcD